MKGSITSSGVLYNSPKDKNVLSDDSKGIKLHSVGLMPNNPHHFFFLIQVFSFTQELVMSL